MNATTVTTMPQHPAPYVDVLPTRAGHRVALTWIPHAEDYQHGEGFAILTSARNRTAYAVSESPDPGRCFLFTKVSGKGTGPRESYLVFCDRDGTHARCECESFTRRGYCKHSDAATTLVANRWL